MCAQVPLGLQLTVHVLLYLTWDLEQTKYAFYLVELATERLEFNGFILKKDSQTLFRKYLGPFNVILVWFCWPDYSVVGLHMLGLIRTPPSVVLRENLVPWIGLMDQFLQSTHFISLDTSPVSCSVFFIIAFNLLVYCRKTIFVVLSINGFDMNLTY